MTDLGRGGVVELLQQLIQNACVNDGSASSGQEVRSAETLASVLEVPGIELELYEPVPGRRSLCARLGSGEAQTKRKSLLLMGHTDVVPVEETGWQRDPFGGELVDGWIWGRGAIDMLNLTASMAIAMRELALANGPTRMKGELIFLAVADEEALGEHGAGWLTENHREEVTADAVITEAGGVPIPSPQGVRLPAIVAEKGSNWSRLIVRGTPGHGSRPFGSDNALVTAAEVVRRLADYRPVPHIPDTWRDFLVGLDMDPEILSALTDPDRVDQVLESLPEGLAREAHAATHTTFAPTMCHSGHKANVIPGRAEITVDIRTLPGQNSEEVRLMIAEALGDLAQHVEVSSLDDESPTSSPTGNELWRSLQRTSESFYQGAAVIPMLSVGLTDARFFRRLGIPSYGFGMFSRKMSLDQFGAMFHGNDERVDVESLELSKNMWVALAREFLGT